jgi:putative sigma-54 modulation protein
MTNQIQFVHIKNHEWMETFIEEKLKKLENKYAWVQHAKVYFKVENAIPAESNICEVELSVPGSTVFAKSSADSFELSVNKVMAELDILLKKKKAKLYQH